MAVTLTDGAAPSINVSRPPYPTKTTISSFPLPSPSGGVAPYNYFISEGSLPKGMNMNPVTGAIEGSSEEIGVFTFKYKAYDSTNAVSNSITKTITLFDLVPPAIPAITPKVWTQGQFVSEELVMNTDWETFDTYKIDQTLGVPLPLINRLDTITGLKKWYFEGIVKSTTGGLLGNTAYNVKDASGNVTNIIFNTTINSAPDGGWFGKITDIRDDEFDITIVKTTPGFGAVNDRNLDIVINMLQK